MYDSGTHNVVHYTKCLLLMRQVLNDNLKSSRNLTYSFAKSTLKNSSGHFPFCHGANGLYTCYPWERTLKRPSIISVTQFRPEKVHALQLEAFSLAIRRLDADGPKPKLHFVGSCGKKEDRVQLQKLKEKSQDLNIHEDVGFFKDLMYRELVQLLGDPIAGIHSTTDELFGIKCC